MYIHTFFKILFEFNSGVFVMLLFADYRCFGNVDSYVT